MHLHLMVQHLVMHLVLHLVLHLSWHPTAYLLEVRAALLLIGNS